MQENEGIENKPRNKPKLAIGDRMTQNGTLLRALLCLLMAASISVLSLAAPLFVNLPESSELPRSFFTHSLMLILSLAAIVWLSKGKISQFGLTVCKFRLSFSYLLWVLPTAAISILQIVGSRGDSLAKSSLPFSPLTIVIFVWIYASISEEIFVRGLVQSYLSTFLH